MDVLIERKGAIGIVTINRAEVKNALTGAMQKDITAAFDEFSSDPEVRAVILTGAGGEFTAGADVKDIGAGGVADSVGRLAILGRMVQSIYNTRKPTVAVVPGVCLGMGWGMALACDIVLAAETARFGAVFRNVGLAPDAGISWFLPRIVGPMRAKELIYSGRFVSGTEAAELGLALEALPQEQLMDRAMELAESMAQGPTLAFALAKRQFDLASTLGLGQFLEAEASTQPIASRSEDSAEAVVAFREKRKPAFKGR